VKRIHPDLTSSGEEEYFKIKMRLYFYLNDEGKGKVLHKKLLQLKVELVAFEKLIENIR